MVGLGYIAQNAVLPAFGHARKNSVPAALVSGDPGKLGNLLIVMWSIIVLSAAPKPITIFIIRHQEKAS